MRNCKEKSLKRLKKDADDVFGKWIRKRDNHKCYTCGKELDEKESQCGHFISRDCLELRYDEKNNHCQCSGCNIFKKGNYIIYTLKMIRDYGIELVEKYKAIKDRKGNFKLTREDYKQLIEKYKSLSH